MSFLAQKNNFQGRTFVRLFLYILFHNHIGEFTTIRWYNLRVVNPFIHTKKEDVIVLDIRDDSVGGMILSLDKAGGRIPEKIFSISKDIPFQRNFDHKRLFNDTAEALAYVADTIARSGFKLPSKIFCIIGPHLHASQIRTIRSKYDAPVLITGQLLKDLVQNDIEKFENEQLNPNGDLLNVILEHKAMQIKLNGYETEFPIKQNASDIEISIFVSMAPGILMNDLKEILSKYFHSDKVDFHSFTFALSDVLRGIFLDKMGFAVVNVENEVSEISVIRNGVIEDVVSFPVGMSLLPKIIMDRFGLSYAQAISYLELFISGSGESEVMARVAEVIEQTKVAWSDLFYQSLKRISYHHLLPDTFYVVAGPKYEDFFLEYVKKAEISNLLMMNRPQRIDRLEPNVFAGLCKNTSDCPDDLHFLAAAVFINKFYEQTDTILERATRIVFRG